MKKVAIDDVKPLFGPAAVKRRLGRDLEATDMAVNYYELAPGDSFAFGYHTHTDQEEIFVIHSGTVTFTTEDGEINVSAGECIRFAPGEFQRGVNTGENRVTALALGAPAESTDLEIQRDCPECGEPTPQWIEMTDDRDALVTRCEKCQETTGRFEYGEVPHA